MRRRHTLLIAVAAFSIAAPAQSADRLILRNLDIISDRTVTSFDEDGVVLDQPRPTGNTHISWDEIERGRVALDQARFDKLLAELSLPLFRIRQRIKTGDYRAAGDVAEKLYARFADRKSQTAYLVCQATMWSRIAGGRREAAVEPFLRCYELLRSRAALSSNLPGPKRLNVDEATALTSELPPVWFDPQAAKAALPNVENAIRAMANPRPAGVYLYYATLAVTAGDNAEAERMLPLLETSTTATTGWADLIRAQQDLADSKSAAATGSLRQQLTSLSEPCRLAAHYLVGLADARSDDKTRCQEGLLTLLTLPAAHGDTQPELAAAALYQAATGLDKLKDGAGAAALRNELTTHYAGTRFEQLARGKTGR
jgi:hypothetical protein